MGPRSFGSTRWHRAILTTVLAFSLLVSTGSAGWAESPSPTPEPTATPSSLPKPAAQPSASSRPSPAAKDDPAKKAKASAGPSKESSAGAGQRVVPPADENSAVVTVKTGGDRSGVQSVAPLPGVVLGLYANPTGGAPVFTCTSDADGDCSVVVPGAQSGGTNFNKRFWVREISSPTDWTGNASLRTGNGDGTGSVATPYRFQTPAVVAGQTYSSQTTPNFLLGSGNDNRAASGGIWQSSRDNPDFAQSCGIDVALVMDFSGSVGSSVGALRTAADTLVNSLQGTPSQMSLFSFGTVSPAENAGPNYPNLTSVSSAAQGTAFKARYAGWTPNGGTNWDRAFSAVAAAPGRPDVTVVITDGNPTFYGEPASGPGNFGRLREIENGIFSANAVKRDGSRMLAIGVGSGADDAATARNLAAISGPTAYNGSNIAQADYFQAADYAAAGTALRSLALGNCLGTVSVTKQIVPAGNTGEDVTGAVAAGAGWDFAARSTATVGGLPAAKTTTDGTGTVNFPLAFPGGVISAPVNLRETQQSGFTLIPQGGQNAVCRNLVTGNAVPVTNDDTTSGRPGFTVNVSPTAAVACTIYNRPAQPRASVRVDKRWVIDGNRYADGAQPDGFTAELSLTGPDGAAATPQGWGETRGGYSVGSSTTVTERVSLASDLCRLDSSQVTLANGAALAQPLPYTTTLSQPENRYEVTNTVTCTSQLTLAKEVRGGDAPAAGWNLSAIAPSGAVDGPQGATGSPGVTAATVTPGVVYQLAESGGDPNYAQVDARTNLESNPLSTGSMTCIEIDAQGDQIPGYSDGLNGGVRVPTGARVRCTAVNRTSTLELRKIVENRFGGEAVPADWTLTATPTGDNLPTGLTAQSVTGNADFQSLNVRPDVAYRLTESGGPAGYQQAGPISCQSPPADAVQGDTVSLEPLGTTRCTFTNADVAAELTLVKVVENGATGGNAEAAAWTLAAAGPTPIVGASGSDAVTSAAVSAGTYVLSEADGPAGYAAGSWTCTGATVDGSSVVVPVGGSVVCSITNTATQPRLTLVKSVINDNGGTAVPTDWTLTADGPTTLDGVTGSDAVTSAAVRVGSYALGENGGPAGYTAGDWSCTGADVEDDRVVVEVGDDVVCTVANDDQGAKLTLVKDVQANDTGSEKVAADWTLTATREPAADGQPVVSGNGDPASKDGVREVAVLAGAYRLVEAGPAGFEAGGWECTGGVVSDGDLVTVAPGGDVECTITNTATSPTLTLIKQVVNDDGGTAKPGDWTLSAKGPSPISGAVGDASVTKAAVRVGTYTLDEDGSNDYTASDWTCEGATVKNDAVTLAEGDDVVCAIVNDDVAPRYSIIKVSDPESGSIVRPGEVIVYTLAAFKTGGVDAIDVVLTDDVSKVLNNATLFEEFEVSAGEASVDGTQITWTIPRLGEAEFLTYAVRVDPGAYGVTLTNTVTSVGSSPCRPEDFDFEDEEAGGVLAGESNDDELCPTTTVHRTPKKAPPVSPSTPPSPSPPPTTPANPVPGSPPGGPGLPDTGGPGLLLTGLGLAFLLAGGGVLVAVRLRRGRQQG